MDAKKLKSIDELMAGNNLRLLEKKCSLRSQVCDLRLLIWHWLEIKQMFDNRTETIS